MELLVSIKDLVYQLLVYLYTEHYILGINNEIYYFSGYDAGKRAIWGDDAA